MEIDVSEVRLYSEQDAKKNRVIIKPDFSILEKTFPDFGERVGRVHHFETKAFTPIEVYDHIKKVPNFYVNNNFYNEIKKLLVNCQINDAPDNYCVITVYLKGKLFSLKEKQYIFKTANSVMKELDVIKEVSINLFAKNKTASLDISSISFSNPFKSKKIIISKKILNDINFKKSISKALIEYCKNHPLNYGSKVDMLKKFKVNKINISTVKIRREFTKSMLSYIIEYSDCSAKQKKSRKMQTELIGSFFLIFKILKTDNFFKKDPHADINTFLYGTVIKDIQRI